MYSYFASKGTHLTEVEVFNVMMQPRMIVNFALWPMHIQINDFEFMPALKRMRNHRVNKFLGGYIKHPDRCTFDEDLARRTFEAEILPRHNNYGIENNSESLPQTYNYIQDAFAGSPFR